MAISLVTPLDQKSMVAIEKLIGQSIPRAEGDYEVNADAGEQSDRPRESRGRDRERSRGGRGKPQRGGRDRERSHEPREARGEARQASEARPTSEGRQRSEERHASEPRRNARPQAGNSQASNSTVPSIRRP